MTTETATENNASTNTLQSVATVEQSNEQQNNLDMSM